MSHHFFVGAEIKHFYFYLILITSFIKSGYIVKPTLLLNSSSNTFDYFNRSSFPFRFTMFL